MSLKSSNKKELCCNICFFTTNNKYYYKKHFSTKKHINLQLCPEIYCETCKNCNKKFKTKNSLILHFFKCNTVSVISRQTQISQKSENLKKEFLTIFENINKNIELYNNTIKKKNDN
jgi:hypothetical protein